MYDIILLLVDASHFSVRPSLLQSVYDTGISEEAFVPMSGCGVPAITPIGTRDVKIEREAELNHSANHSPHSPSLDITS